jgi:hypothetical protein
MNSISNHSMISCFPTIQSFQAYFQVNDELTLPANQPLEIQDIAILRRPNENRCDGKEILPEGTLLPAVYILDQMLLPLAKSITLYASEGGSMEYSASDQFKLVCSKAVTFKATKGPFHTRLTDLFKLMIASSITEVEFDPNQKLMIHGLTQTEWEFVAPNEVSAGKMVRLRTPSGYRVKVHGDRDDGDGEDYIHEKGKIISGTTEKKYFGIRSISSKWRLTLCKQVSFSSIGEFSDYMRTNGELKVPPNQVFRITDTNFSRIQKAHSKFRTMHFGVFALNQILLPLGKRVVIVRIPEGRKSIINWKYHSENTDYLEISCEDGFILRTEFGDLAADLTNLGQMLITSRCTSLELQPEQNLVLYGLTKDQIRRFDAWKSSDLSVEGFGRLFQPFNPIGFLWSISFNKDLSAHYGTLNYENAECVVISSNEKFQLKLERAKGEFVAINLLNHSSPELLQGILEADSNAFIFILFRALHYYCCDEFHLFGSLEKLPDCFKETTLRLLSDLLTNNREFYVSYRLVLDDPEMMLKQMDGILNLTHEEFSTLDHSTFPPPVKTILSELMKLVYEELSSSIFITQCIRLVQEGLENGTLNKFIRETTDEETSLPPPASSQGATSSNT